MPARRPTPAEHEAFLQQYQDYVRDVLNPTRERLKDKLEPWVRPGYWATHVDGHRSPFPTPVHEVSVRIKRPEAVVDKILRNAGRFEAGLSMDSVRQMTDTVRARVVAYFISDLDLIAKEFLSQLDIIVSEDFPPRSYVREEDYERLKSRGFERHPKRLGTAALVFRCRFAPGDGPEFELQVRTLVDHLWSNFEHRLGYRERALPRAEIADAYYRIADDLMRLERDVDALHRELSQRQSDVTVPDEAILSPESLPTVLREAGVACAQGEIDGLLKILASRDVKTVEQLRARLGPANLQAISDTYLESAGWTPTAFEVVTTAAGTQPEDPASVVADIARTNIAYLAGWSQLRLRR
jgi:ppGpp synthetase/RelA/SpoT-type nucleotidyltranferase